VRAERRTASAGVRPVLASPYRFSAKLPGALRVGVIPARIIGDGAA